MAKFKKREILELLLNQESYDAAINHILSKLNVERTALSDLALKSLKLALASLKGKRNTRFQAQSRMLDKFEAKYSNWLDSEFNVPDLASSRNEEAYVGNMGRPQLEFREKSDRSQRREASSISAQHNNDTQRIILAGCHAARHSGEKDLRAVLKEVAKSPERAAKVRKLLDGPVTTITKKSPDEALAFLIDNSVSKSVYTNMRLATKSSGADIWPSYNKVREAKEKLRPPKEEIHISESRAEVSVQALLNHTSKRIIELQSEVILHAQQKSQTTEITTELVCSWGFDGSSGHSAYKQRYCDKEIEGTDENLFATTLIPLQLSTNSGIILWNNRTSQSARFCRPVKLEYVAESRDVILRQKQAIEDQIEKLQPLDIMLKDFKVQVRFLLFMTLIDGKVLSIVTNTASMQTCPICHATSKHFNDLSNIKSRMFSPQSGSLQYGISPLHAWIRFFELCLHIAYRLGIKTWQVRREEHKKVFAEQKHHIQTILWQKLGLRVDKPRSGGSGNSNDGNTARRAFENTDLFSECLGLDAQLLYNFKIILITLSCQLPVNATHFEEFCVSTAKLYVSLYPWYPMSSTLHRILMHGGEILQNSILPVGMLGEEASEARNKDYKNYRQRHSRKHSRSANLEDMFYRVMDSSDPIISSLNLQSRLKLKKRLLIPDAVKKLLDIPAIDPSSAETCADVDDEDQDDIGTSQTLEQLDNLELSEEELNLES